MREYELDPSSTNSSLAALIIRRTIRVVGVGGPHDGCCMFLLTGRGPYEKEFSIVSSPIFACSSRIRSLPSEASTSSPKIAAAFSSRSVFQAVTWVAWTSWCAAICATVFSPRIASRATRALNDAEWFHLGFFMDLCPPVAILHL